MIGAQLPITRSRSIGSSMSKSPPITPWFLLVAGPLLLVGLAMLSPRAAAVEPGNANLAVVQQLDDRDYGTRQFATQALMREPITVDAVLGLYAKTTSAEQRHRLLLVAHHHFIRQAIRSEFKQPGSGFIGIKLSTTVIDQDGRPDTTVIIVDSTIPGFPGHAALSSGDLILGLNGEAVGTDLPDAARAEAFIRSIKSMRGGQMIELTVRRDDRTFAVSLRLENEHAKAVLDSRTESLRRDYLLAWHAVRRQFEMIGTQSEPLAIHPAPDVSAEKEQARRQDSYDPPSLDDRPREIQRTG